LAGREKERAVRGEQKVKEKEEKEKQASAMGQPHVPAGWAQCPHPPGALPAGLPEKKPIEHAFSTLELTL
jgi:hypothetical protein